MDVLVLEDEAIVSKYLMEYIINKTLHKPILARSIQDAERILELHHIDCIVLDSNMPALGLTPEEQAVSQLGKFTGWLWLSRHVLPIWPEFRERAIIYSAYPDALRDRFGDELSGIRQVDKNPARGGIDELARNLDEIASALRRTNTARTEAQNGTSGE